MKLRISFFILLISCSACFHAQATNYYVSTLGDDQNPGTIELPWQSIDQVSATTLRPGDEVYFHGGETFFGALVLQGGGSTQEPVIVASYGDGQATLHSESQNTISGYNVGGFQIENLILQGEGSVGDFRNENLIPQVEKSKGTGIFFFADDENGKKYPGVVINNVDISGEPDFGISFGSWNPSNSGWEFLKVANINLHDNGVGMETYGYTLPGVTTYAIGSIEIRGSEFHDNRSSGLVVCGASGGTIQECSFHHNQNTGGCWTWGVSGITIEHCVSFCNLKGKANDGFGFDLDGGSQNCTIQYCLSYENETSGFVIFDYPQSARTANNTVRYCISENDGRSDSEWGSFEIFPWGDTPIKNCHIYNCVAYLTSRSGMTSVSGFEVYGKQNESGYGSGKTIGCSFCNNVVYLDKPGLDMRFFTCNLGAIQPHEIALQNNIYYSSEDRNALYFKDRLYTNFEEWQSSFLHQENDQGVNLGEVINPGFSSVGTACEVKDPKQISCVASYHPVSISPCLNAGLDLKVAFGTDFGFFDFAGNALPLKGPFSIGAFAEGSPARDEPRGRERVATSKNS